MSRKKCDHGENFFCPACSKIKMIVCLKNGAKPKYENENSLTRYSMLTEQKKSDSEIIEKMKNRLLIRKGGTQGECFEGDFNVVLFKDNLTNQLIEKYP